MAISELGNDRIVESVGRPQPEFMVRIVEDIDCTGFGARELGRLGDDGSQDGFKVDG
jgi:hypothetical protein